MDVSGSSATSAEATDGYEAGETKKSGKSCSEAGSGPSSWSDDAGTAAGDGSAAGFRRLVVGFRKARIESAGGRSWAVDDAVAEKMGGNAAGLAGTTEAAVLEFLGIKSARTVPRKMEKLRPSDLESGSSGGHGPGELDDNCGGFVIVGFGNGSNGAKLGSRKYRHLSNGAYVLAANPKVGFRHPWEEYVQFTILTRARCEFNLVKVEPKVAFRVNAKLPYAFYGPGWSDVAESFVVWEFDLAVGGSREKSRTTERAMSEFVTGFEKRGRMLEVTCCGVGPVD